MADRGPYWEALAEGLTAALALMPGVDEHGVVAWFPCPSCRSHIVATPKELHHKVPLCPEFARYLEDWDG